MNRLPFALGIVFCFGWAASGTAAEPACKYDAVSDANRVVALDDACVAKVREECRNGLLTIVPATATLSYDARCESDALLLTAAEGVNCAASPQCQFKLGKSNLELAYQGSALNQRCLRAPAGQAGKPPWDQGVSRVIAASVEQCVEARRLVNPRECLLPTRTASERDLKELSCKFDAFTEKVLGLIADELPKPSADVAPPAAPAPAASDGPAASGAGSNGE